MALIRTSGINFSGVRVVNGEEFNNTTSKTFTNKKGHIVVVNSFENNAVNVTGGSIDATTVTVTSASYVNSKMQIVTLDSDNATITVTGAIRWSYLELELV